MKQPKQGPKPPKHRNWKAAEAELRREALAIVRKCKAPASWGEDTAWFLLTVSAGRYFVPQDRSPETEHKRAMLLWYLIRECSGAVIAALHDLEKLYEKRFDSSQFVAFYYGSMDAEFWDGEPPEVLDRLFATGNTLKEKMGMTPETIKNARKRIRKASK